MARNSQEVKGKPTTTPEQAENECISLAFKLAKKKLSDGTASSQLITEFVKAGSTKRQAELEKLQKENALLVAKVEALESQKRTEDVYQKALQAMRTYAGQGDDDEYEY